MPNAKFNTISTELVEHAENAYEHFRELGYSVKIEPYEIHFPSRPALVCKTNHTQHVILVCNRIDMTQLAAWVSLAKSLNRDFRISICIPENSATKHLPKCQLEIRKFGVGIYVSTSDNFETLAEPVDQNIQVSLPDIRSLPNGARRVLRPAYEHFRGGRWRDCFEEACKALEQEIRPYFWQAIVSGRLQVFDANGRAKNLTKERVDRLTLGQLAHEISCARPQNAMDSQIQNAIDRINPDRVGLVHKNQRKSTERRLRKHVGVHMHVMIQVIRELKK